MTQVQEFKIMDGPSKFDLMVSLFDGKKVEFAIKGHVNIKRIRVRINGVTFEGRDRQSWFVKGEIVDVLKGDEVVPAAGLLLFPFGGYYDSRCRNGSIQLSFVYL